MTDSLLIRNVEVDGHAGLDVRLRDGRIEQIGRGLARTGEDLDGAGGALIPGLVDHHIHLLALAAQADSVRLDDAADLGEVGARLGRAAATRPPHAWLRATGYHDGAAGMLDASGLDRLVPDRPLRVQHRSGALWVLNTAALARVIGRDPPPPCVELDVAGQPTGRIWRGDGWLSARIGRIAPPLAPVGRALAAFGITGVTDASATTDATASALFAAAHAAGDLPQRITLMSAGELAPRPGIAVGPVKILLDEADLPDIEALVARLAAARRWGRRVAVHCATAVELAFALAVFETAGVMSGDRIEHASVVPEAAIEVLARLRLTVVTQPGFIAARGDRYMREIPPAEHADLYRLGRLRRAGVRVAASSDAPYGPLDPWAGMRAAVERRTHDGWRLGPEEAVGRAAALSLYLGGPEAPAGAPRRLVVGAPADLCLLTLPLAAALEELDAAMVAVTLVGGRYSLGAPTAAEETLETPACARSHVKLS